MTSIEVVENKISAVKKYLHILEGYQKYSENEIQTDLNIRGALERYLYLAIQSTIDLAESLVSLKKLRKPSTFAETFLILNEQKMISDELTDKMVKMTGFRNIITHDYAEIDYSIVYKILNEGLTDLESFLSSIENI